MLHNHMKYPDHLLKLFQVLKRLPGVGSRSAERFAFHLLHWPPAQLQDFAALLATLPQKLAHCPECGCLLDEGRCVVCNDTRRDPTLLCVVASAKDVYSMEETRQFKGLYHVLGALLSPMEGRGPEQLGVERLKARIAKLKSLEIILALDSTLEGDATALYLKKELAPLGIELSRLAFGLPMGSSFDYIDGGTLAKALQGRCHL